MKRPIPPALWTQLLRLAAGSKAAPTILGDMREEYVTHALPRLGRRGASRWYARQVLSSIGPLLAGRFAAVRHDRSRSNRVLESTSASHVLSRLVQDVRYAARMLTQNPGFSATVIVTLALGLGANTAIFGVVNAVLLRPLEYDQPNRLVRVWELRESGRGNVSPQDFLDWRTQNQSFDGIAAFTAWGHATVTSGDEPQRLLEARVSAELFDLLRVQPVVGRGFVRSDEDVSEPHVVIITHEFWRRRFGGDQTVLEATLNIDGNDHAVVGVLPAGFRFLDFSTSDRPDLWVPLRITARHGRGGHWLHGVGRLADGVSFDAALADLRTIAARLEQEHPNSNTGHSVQLVPLQESLVSGTRTALLLLMGTVGLVLLIACANVANLLLARGTARRREIALRIALGASRGRIMRQLLTENSVFALLGGLAGFVLAIVTTDALVGLGAGGVPRADEIGIDATALAFTILLSLVAGPALGLLPAIAITRREVADTLRDGTRSGSGDRTGNTIRSVFSIGQIALTLVLLIGAGLLIKSLALLSRVDPGLNPDNAISVEVVLPRQGYESRDRMGAFYRELLARVRALPGVEAAGAVNNIPFKFHSCDGFYVDDRPRPAPGEAYCAYNQLGTPGYLRAMGIRVLEGRGVSDADGPEAPQVVIVNERLAERFWPGESALGKRLTYGTVSREIVGVVSSVKRRGLDRDAGPEMIIPHLQDSWDGQMFVVARSALEPASVVAAVRSVVGEMDRNVPIGDVAAMKVLVEKSYASPRFRALLLGLFAAIALLLSAVGIFGVVGYSVSQRTQEIGVRMALGASAPNVLRQVLGQGLKLAAIGIGFGLVGSYFLTRVLDNLVFGIITTDVATFIALPVLLAVITLLACYIPARRATRVDPVAALREE